MFMLCVVWAAINSAVQLSSRDANERTDYMTKGAMCQFPHGVEGKRNVLPTVELDVFVVNAAV